MTSLFAPTYYEATPLKKGVIRLTDETTRTPVLEKDPFYQEKQNGGKCSVHSLDAFAGTKIVNIPDFLKINNDTQKEIFEKIGMLGRGISDIHVLKANGVYLDKIEDLDVAGVNPAILKAYLEKYKEKLFYLPKDCSIIVTEGHLTSSDIQKEMYNIQKNPTLNRLILGVKGAHYLTIRKDKIAQWRVIDSQTQTHNFTSIDKTKRIQPRFATLKEAVEYVSRCYNSQSCILIFPSKEKTDKLKWLAIGIFVAIACTALIYSRFS